MKYAKEFLNQKILRSMKRGGFSSPVLEVGCGTGETLACLAKEYAVQGIDLSEEAVQACRIEGLDVEKNDFKNVSRKVNSIVCVDIIEHVADDQAFADQLYNALNQGGKLFVMVPSGRFMGDDVALGHCRRYSRSAIVALLRKSNFTVESAEMFGYPFFYYARLCMNFLYRRKIPQGVQLHDRTIKSSYENPFDGTLPVKLGRMVGAMPGLSTLLGRLFDLQYYCANGNRGFAVIVIATKQ
jgi:SAM-dependent methyltransferase